MAFTKTAQQAISRFYILFFYRFARSEKSSCPAFMDISFKKRAETGSSAIIYFKNRTILEKSGNFPLYLFYDKCNTRRFQKIPLSFSQIHQTTNE